MEIVRLGSAIRIRGSRGNVDPDRQVGLAFASSAVPRLRRWMAEKQRIEQEIAEVSQRLESWKEPDPQTESEPGRLDREREDVQQQLLRHHAALRHLDARPWPYLKPVWMAIWGRTWRPERAALLAETARAAARRDEIDLRFTSAISALEQAFGELEGRRADLEALPRVIDGLRRLDYVLVPSSVAVAGEPDPPGTVEHGWLVADQLAEVAELDAVTSPTSEAALEELRHSLTTLMDVPAVIRDVGSGSESERPEAGDRPLGFERDLVAASDELGRLVDRSHSQQIQVPLLDPDDPLVALLADRLADPEGFDPVGVPAELDRQSAVRLKGLVRGVVALREVVRSQQQQPTALFQAVAEAAQGVPTLADDLSLRRGRSAAALAQTIAQARMGSTLARYRFFCPECNAFPAYLAQVYGIHRRGVRSMDTTSLRAGLTRYRERRLDTRLGRSLAAGSLRWRLLQERWERVFDELGRLEQSGRYHREQLAALDGHVSLTTADRLQKSLTERKIRDGIARYGALVDELIRRPLLVPEHESLRDRGNDEGLVGDAVLDAAKEGVLWTESRMQYDPSADSTPWSCPACETSFGTATALLGAVDRTRAEVVYPLARSLWAEDSVRVPAEAALERAVQRAHDVAQEEARALEEPIGAFRNEARGLRARVEEAHARGVALARRLVLIAEQFERFGLLPAEAFDQVRTGAGGTTDRMNETQEALNRLTAAEEALQRVVEVARGGRPAPHLPVVDFVRSDLSNLNPLAARPATEPEPEASSGTSSVEDEGLAAGGGAEGGAVGDAVGDDTTAAAGSESAPGESQPSVQRDGGSGNAPPSPNRLRRSIRARRSRSDVSRRPVTFDSVPPSSPPQTEPTPDPAPTEGRQTHD